MTCLSWARATNFTGAPQWTQTAELPGSTGRTTARLVMIEVLATKGLSAWWGGELSSSGLSLGACEAPTLTRRAGRCELSEGAGVWVRPPCTQPRPLFRA